MTRTRSRRSFAYAVSLALMAIGSLSGHAFAYRAVAPAGDEHAALLERTGHGYLAFAHLGLALLVTVVLVGLVLVVVGTANGCAFTGGPVWLFAVVLSVGFAVQEHVERFIATGDVPLDVVVEPTFTVGLLLQLVFALAAAFLTRALLALGEAIGRALAAHRSRRLAARGCRFKDESFAAPRASIVALGHAQRAPPPLPSFG